MQWWIVRQLRSKNADIRRRAAFRLGQRRRRGAVPALAVALLDDPVWEVRRTAAEALGMIGDAIAAETLVKALRDKDWAVRSAVAMALANCGDESSLDSVMTALSDSDEFIRSAAVIALARIGGTRAVKALVRTLQDDSPEVMEQTLQVLAAMSWKAISPTDKALFAVAKRNWEAAVLAGAAAVEPLTRALYRSQRKGGGGLAVTVEIVRALGDIGDAAAVPALIEALRTPEDAIASEAAIALAQTAEPGAAAPALLEALMRRGPNVRTAVLAALGTIAQGTIDPFLPVLLSPQAVPTSVLEQVLTLVADSHDGRALPILLQMAMDLPRVAPQAIAALEQVRERTHAPMDGDELRALAAIKRTLAAA